MDAGIYAIENLLNGKYYIGSAVSIKDRWSQHKSDLSLGKHHSQYLQRAWLKYGPEAFEFFPIEPVDRAKDLTVREQVWINEFRSADPAYGYNISPTAGSALGVKHTAEARARMSAAKIGSKLPDEHCANISAALMGRTHTAEARAKLSAVLMGRKHTDEHRANNAAAKRGRKHTAETIAKMSAAHRGRKYTAGHKLSEEHRAKLSAATTRQWAAHRARGARANLCLDLSAC